MGSTAAAAGAARCCVSLAITPGCYTGSYEDLDSIYPSCQAVPIAPGRIRSWLRSPCRSVGSVGFKKVSHAHLQAGAYSEGADKISFNRTGVRGRRDEGRYSR